MSLVQDLTFTVFNNSGLSLIFPFTFTVSGGGTKTSTFKLNGVNISPTPSPISNGTTVDVTVPSSSSDQTINISGVSTTSGTASITAFSLPANILDNNLNQTARVRIRGNLNPGTYIMTIATPGRSSDYNIGRYLDIYKISSSTDNGSTWSNVIPDLYPEMLTTICPRVLSLSVSNDTVYRVSWNGVSGGFGFVTDPEPYIIIEGPY